MPSAARRTDTIGACLAVVASKLWLLAGVSPLRLGDTVAFKTGAWSLTSVRPVVIPTAYWLLGENDGRIFLAQTAVSIACWCGLASSVSAHFDRRSARVVALVALVGLCAVYTRWDAIVIGESFSVSLTVALIALVLHAHNTSWSRPTMVAVACVGWLWALSRDLNATVLGLGAVVVAVSATRHRPRLWLAAALLLAGVVGEWSSSASDRWVYPFDDVVAFRVLTHPTMRAYFVAHGMPVNDALERRTAHDASDGSNAFANDPQLADYRRWRDKSGERTYADWAVTHPVEIAAQPIEHAGDLVAVSSPYYDVPGTRPVPGWSLFHPDDPRVVVAELAVVLIAVRIRPHPVMVIVLLLSLAGMALAWFGDGLDPPRHALIFDVGLRLAIVMTVAAALEHQRSTVGRTRRFRSSPDPERPQSRGG